MTEAVTTTDRDTIRKWAEERDGHPAMVDADSEGGILRIDFGEPNESLKRISWEEFFRTFEESNLAFLYQERAKDGISRFNKFVDRK